ncbi:hypothetical protein AT6N2_C1286 [Agrobacterium tumefaciens]|nr:hypothetical protein AT6N2_C1286 [Agrobacterium tumefaciens]
MAVFLDRQSTVAAVPEAGTDGNEDQVGSNRQHQNFPCEAHEHRDIENDDEDHRQHQVATDAAGAGFARPDRKSADEKVADQHRIGGGDVSERLVRLDAEKAKIDREKHQHCAHRRRHADKELVLPGGFHRALDHDVETCQTQAGGNDIDERGDPADGTRLIKQISVDDEGRGDAEIHDIGKRIHLLAEFGCRLHHAGDTAVDAIEESREQHHADGEFETPLESKAHTAQARTDRQNGDEIGDQKTKGNFAQSRATAAVAAAIGFSVLLRLRNRRFHAHALPVYPQPRRLRTGPLAEPNSASTVSPAIAVWPTDTRGSKPAGRKMSRREPKRIRPKRSPASTGSFGFTQHTIRRATMPAICTTPTLPCEVSMTRPLRSLSSDALSTSALRKRPGR